jgi:hypothetical protein
MSRITCEHDKSVWNPWDTLETRLLFPALALKVRGCILNLAALVFNSSSIPARLRPQ